LYGQDKTLVCADCNQEFSFTASEQQFYADRQFSEPRRCASCRAAKKAARGDSGGGYSGGGRDSGYSGGGYSSGGSGGYSSGPREMFSATCSSCGKEAQVPFRPSGAKPVYCSDCFTSQRASSNRY
jgi:CxxC-x17-CxxC domain-containing protein